MHTFSQTKNYFFLLFIYIKILLNISNKTYIYNSLNKPPQRVGGNYLSLTDEIFLVAEYQNIGSRYEEFFLKIRLLDTTPYLLSRHERITQDISEHCS